MFLDFYNLREHPFGCSPDPRFLYLGTSHREALASLFYAMKSDCGFAALIADPGLGKTTLTFQLFEKLQPVARTVFLCQTQCNSRELLRYILNELGTTNSESMDMVSMHNKIKAIASSETAAGRRFILAIDEAQNLDAEVLETIRLLSNFETSRAKLLQILLIGQPQLARKLTTPALMQLRQRISVFARLEPFDLEDTGRYIAHRLQFAGCSSNGLFTREAVMIIKEASQGIPRNINNLCFSALTLGFATGRKQIDSTIMREVVADLNVVQLDQALISAPNASVATPEIAVGPGRRRSSEKSSVRWAVGTACVAACLAVGVVLPSFSRKLAPIFHTMTEAAGAVQVSPPTTKKSLGIGSDSGGIPSVDEVGTEGPTVVSAQSNLAKNEPETTTVVVQAGDTLRHISLRTLGGYDDTIVEQIRKLNPLLGDPNHIEAGEQIRVPYVSTSFESSVAAGPSSDHGKN